jgi:hypothetical protein
MEKPLSGTVGEKMIEHKFASLQILQEHPGVLKNPLGKVGVLGIAKGLLARMEERLESFLFVDIKDCLGRMIEDMGQALMTL